MSDVSFSLIQNGAGLNVHVFNNIQVTE